MLKSVSKASRTSALFCAGVVLGILVLLVNWKSNAFRLKGRIIGVALGSGAVDGRPVDLGERRSGFEALHEVGIGDERATERHEVSETFGDQAIAARCIHLSVGNQRPPED